WRSTSAGSSPGRRSSGSAGGTTTATSSSDEVAWSASAALVYRPPLLLGLRHSPRGGGRAMSGAVRRQHDEGPSWSGGAFAVSQPPVCPVSMARDGVEQGRLVLSPQPGRTLTRSRGSQGENRHGPHALGALADHRLPCQPVLEDDAVRDDEAQSDVAGRRLSTHGASKGFVDRRDILTP